MSEDPAIYRAEPAKYQVFVDFENVPTVDLELIGNHPVLVTLLIGKNQKRLDTSFSLQLHKFSEKVQPIEVGASGRNALDLILSYYLGRVAGPAFHGQCFIVSKDKDFDPLISHLMANGIQVSRHDSFAALPFLSPPKKSSPPKKAAPAKDTAPKPPQDRLEKLVTALRTKSTARPGKRKALLAHINNMHGNKLSPAELEKVITDLVGRGVINIDAKDKISYPN
ncbi:MAG: PIN domain-containing protein [Lacunisphaera sp.]|nr:PIN domain-containing protein [Lacunisphaera sp.]